MKCQSRLVLKIEKESGCLSLYCMHLFFDYKFENLCSDSDFVDDPKDKADYHSRKGDDC